jgi:PEP-CTERM motif
VVTGNNEDPNSVNAEPDFFKFSGLEPNVGFTLHVERTGGTLTNVRVHDPGATPPALDFGSVGSSPVDLEGTIPASGMLIFEASGGEGVSYRVTLSAPLSVPVPAPSTLALTALGAALTGVFARRRRTVRQSATS